VVLKSSRMVDRIKHERILLKRRARVFIGKEDTPNFEMFCFSRDLSISGIFLNTETLMRIGLHLEIDLEVRPDEWLRLNGEVTRRIEFGDREHAAGIGVAFGELSDRSHETLLRYFLTDKVLRFYQIFLKRFPHLHEEMTEQDIALVVNLWEDNRHQLVEDTPRDAPVKASTRIFEIPLVKGSRRPMPMPVAAETPASTSKKNPPARKPGR
jgi:hypothetical protein